MTLSHEQYVERATRGYRFLASSEGQRLGFNVHLLNPDTLDLSDGCDCALGETYEGGSYWDAVDRLAEEEYPATSLDQAWSLENERYRMSSTLIWERRHGFLVGMGDDTDPVRGYALLTAAWREVIKRERDQEG
jgi:hypothetical protein